MSYKRKAEYRLAKANAYCRMCDVLLERNIDKAIFIDARSIRNGPVILCVDCLAELVTLVEADE